jgi:hypothetical protein
MKYTRSKLHESSPRTAKTASGGVFGLHANSDVSTYNGTALVQIVLHLATTKEGQITSSAVPPPWSPFRVWP